MSVTRRLETPVVAALVALVVGAGGATAATAITGKGIKDGSLTGADVKDGSIGVKDLARTARPRPPVVGGQGGTDGRPGTDGKDGAAGRDGAAGTTTSVQTVGQVTYRAAGPFDNPDGELTGGVATCPDGQVAVGGGAYGDSEAPGQAVSTSAPVKPDGSLDPRAWRVDMANRTGVPSSFSVYVVCTAQQPG